MTWKYALAAIVVLVIVFVALHYSGYLKIEAFSMLGTPDWVIRNKGNKHSKRSDADASTPGSGGWSMKEFKRSVRAFNKKAAI